MDNSDFKIKVSASPDEIEKMHEVASAMGLVLDDIVDEEVVLPQGGETYVVDPIKFREMAESGKKAIEESEPIDFDEIYASVPDVSINTSSPAYQAFIDNVSVIAERLSVVISNIDMDLLNDISRPNIIDADSYSVITEGETESVVSIDNATDMFENVEVNNQVSELGGRTR